MKDFKLLLPVLSLFFCLPAFSQVQIDKQLQLTGSGTDAKITGIKSVSGNQEAVSVDYLQRDSLKFAVDAGSTNTYAVNLNPAVTVHYTKGMTVYFIASSTNTGSSTLNVNGLGIVNLYKNYNQNLGAGDIKSGQAVTAMYDGANFQLLSPPSNSSSSIVYSTANLTSNNMVVNAGSASYLQINSNSSTSSNRTFYLAAGTQTGQQLVIENISPLLSSGPPGQAILPTGSVYSGSAMCQLTGNMNFVSTHSNISLVWNGSIWVELNRNASGDKIVFSYTGSNQTWTVPANVTQLFVKLWGAGGTGGGNTSYVSSGGGGAFLNGTLSVNPGDVLTIIVGQGGNDSLISSAFGGGGMGNPLTSTNTYSGFGGGRSAIQNSSAADLVTAAGGGGGADQLVNNYMGNGGGGGTTSGSSGLYSSCTTEGGGGGTTPGGAGGIACAGSTYNGGAGSQYTGGNIASTHGQYYLSWGGGGGGGYFGGGAGANYNGGGGGGGSSYYPNSGFNLIANTAGATIPNGSAGPAAAGGNSDIDYIAGTGIGGVYESSAGNGLVVIPDFDT